MPALTGAALLLLAGLPLARRYADPEPGPGRRTTLPPLPVTPLATLVVAMALLGAIFGVLQVAVTAYAGDPGSAGLLYAGLGAGSALAGLACGWLPARFGAVARYRTFAAGLLAGMTLIAFGETMLPVAIVLAGATIAPYMISVYTLAERASAGRVAVALTIVGAGGPVGTATGQAAAGLLIDSHGPHAAFLLTPALAAAALLVAHSPRSS